MVRYFLCFLVTILAFGIFGLFIGFSLILSADPISLKNIVSKDEVV